MSNTGPSLSLLFGNAPEEMPPESKHNAKKNAYIVNQMSKSVRKHLGQDVDNQGAGSASSSGEAPGFGPSVRQMEKEPQWAQERGANRRPAEGAHVRKPLGSTAPKPKAMNSRRLPDQNKQREAAEQDQGGNWSSASRHESGGQPSDGDYGSMNNWDEHFDKNAEQGAWEGGSNSNAWRNAAQEDRAQDSSRENSGFSSTSNTAQVHDQWWHNRGNHTPREDPGQRQSESGEFNWWPAPDYMQRVEHVSWNDRSHEKGKGDRRGRGKGKNDWHNSQKGRGTYDYSLRDTALARGWDSMYEATLDWDWNYQQNNWDDSSHQQKRHRTEDNSYRGGSWGRSKGQWANSGQSRQQWSGSGGRGWKQESYGKGSHNSSRGKGSGYRSWTEEGQRSGKGPYPSKGKEKNKREVWVEGVGKGDSLCPSAYRPDSCSFEIGEDGTPIFLAYQGKFADTASWAMVDWMVPVDVRNRILLSLAFIDQKVAEGQVESEDYKLSSAFIYNELGVSFTDAIHGQLENFYSQAAQEIQDNAAENTPAAVEYNKAGWGKAAHWIKELVEKSPSAYFAAWPAVGLFIIDSLLNGYGLTGDYDGYDYTVRCLDATTGERLQITDHGDEHVHPLERWGYFHDSESANEWYLKTIGEDELAKELVEEGENTHRIEYALMERDLKQQETDSSGPYPHGHAEGWHEVPEGQVWQRWLEKKRELALVRYGLDAAKQIQEHFQEAIGDFVGKSLGSLCPAFASLVKKNREKTETAQSSSDGDFICPDASDNARACVVANPPIEYVLSAQDIAAVRRHLTCQFGEYLDSSENRVLELSKEVAEIEDSNPRIYIAGGVLEERISFFRDLSYKTAQREHQRACHKEKSEGNNPKRAARVGTSQNLDLFKVAGEASRNKKRQQSLEEQIKIDHPDYTEDKEALIQEWWVRCDNLKAWNRDHFKHCCCLECGRAIDLDTARFHVPMGMNVTDGLRYFDAVTNYCCYECLRSRGTADATADMAFFPHFTARGSQFRSLLKQSAEIASWSHDQRVEHHLKVRQFAKEAYLALHPLNPDLERVMKARHFWEKVAFGTGVTIRADPTVYSYFYELEKFFVGGKIPLTKANFLRLASFEHWHSVKTRGNVGADGQHTKEVTPIPRCYYCGAAGCTGQSNMNCPSWHRGQPDNANWGSLPPIVKIGAAQKMAVSLFDTPTRASLEYFADGRNASGHPMWGYYQYQQALTDLSMMDRVHLGLDLPLERMPEFPADRAATLEEYVEKLFPIVDLHQWVEYVKENGSEYLAAATIGVVVDALDRLGEWREKGIPRIRNHAEGRAPGEVGPWFEMKRAEIDASEDTDVQRPKAEPEVRNPPAWAQTIRQFLDKEYEIQGRKGSRPYLETDDAIFYLIRQVGRVVQDLDKETSAGAIRAAMSVRECEGTERPFTGEETKRLKSLVEGAHRMVMKYGEKETHLNMLKSRGEIDGRLATFGDFDRALKLSLETLVSPNTGKTFMFAETRTKDDKSVLTRADLERYLKLESQVNLHKVRQMLLQVKENDLTDHQKRGLLVSFERLSQPAVSEAVAKWDGARINEERVSALLGQDTREIRSLDKGGVVSSAARAGIMIHKLGEKKWSVVLAHANQIVMEGTGMKSSAINLRKDFQVKNDSFGEEMMRALDSLIESLPDDDSSIPDLNLFIMDSAGNDGGLQLTRSAVPFEGRMVSKAEAAALVMNTVTTSIQKKNEIEESAEIQAHFVADLLSAEDLEVVAREVTPDSPIFEQIWDRLEELPDDVQNRLKEVRESYIASQDEMMDPEECEARDEREKRLKSLIRDRTHDADMSDGAGSGQDAVTSLAHSIFRDSAPKMDPQYEARQAERADQEDRRRHEKGKGKSRGGKQGKDASAGRAQPLKAAGGKFKSPKVKGGVSTFTALDNFQMYDPTLNSLSFESMDPSMRAEMVRAALMQGTLQDPAKAKAIAKQIAETAILLDRHTGKRVQEMPTILDSERPVQIVVARKDSVFLHGGSAGSSSRRLSYNAGQAEPVPSIIQAGRAPFNNDNQQVLQDEASFDQEAYEQSFRALQSRAVREWLYLAGALELLPNGVAIAAKSWEEKGCGIPYFSHGRATGTSRGKKNAGHYQNEMARLQKSQPPNFIKFEDKDRYLGWGYRVVDQWEDRTISRGYAQSLKAKYEPSDFSDDAYKKTVYRCLPTNTDAVGCVSQLSDTAQERLISETFRVEVIHVVKPDNPREFGETDFDRNADIEECRKAGLGDDKSAAVNAAMVAKRGGLVVLYQCSLNCGVKPQTAWLPRMPGDSLEKIESKEFLYEFSRWPGKYLLNDSTVSDHLSDTQHYAICAENVCRFCATGGRMGSGNGNRWLTQSPRYCHYRHHNKMVNLTEDPTYAKGQPAVGIRSVAVPSNYEASPDPTLSGAVRFLGNTAGITFHMAQLIFAENQVNSSMSWVKVTSVNGQNIRIHRSDISAVEGALVRWNIGAQGTGESDRYGDSMCRLVSMKTLPAGPLNRQMVSNDPLPSFTHPHPSGGPYRTKETMNAREKAGERFIVSQETLLRDPWSQRRTPCPEVIPPDLGQGSLARYKSASGGIRSGDSYDCGASMWNHVKEEPTNLGQGAHNADLKAAAKQAETGAIHGFQDWPIFTSGDVQKTEPEGLPDFRAGEEDDSSHPLVSEDRKALLVEYNKPGRELEDRLLPPGNRFAGYYHVSILHLSEHSRLRTQYRTSYILVCWMQQFGDGEGYVLGWAIPDNQFINMVANGMDYVDFNFANQMWQAWNNGGLNGAWEHWYDAEEDEWDDETEWDGYNVGGPHYAALEENADGYVYMEDPEGWIFNLGWAGVENPDGEMPDFFWNWDTITNATTEEPLTIHGAQSVYTAESAASVVGTEGAEMEVDAGGVSPLLMTQQYEGMQAASIAASGTADNPSNPNWGSSSSGSQRSRLILEHSSEPAANLH